MPKARICSTRLCTTWTWWKQIILVCSSFDSAQVTHWLDHAKPIKKQMKVGPAYALHFRVKYYSSEPNNLREEFTRYLFVLQLRHDILSGKLKCPYETAVELAALCLQAELGECELPEHTPELVSEFRFIPNQTEAMEFDIFQRWKEYRERALPRRNSPI